MTLNGEQISTGSQGTTPSTAADAAVQASTSHNVDLDVGRAARPRPYDRPSVGSDRPDLTVRILWSRLPPRFRVRRNRGQ
ncbi:hypothetical protein MRX96_025130 [Rhipicephalus microplus]